jgi:hypothetical protein
VTKRVQTKTKFQSTSKQGKGGTIKDPGISVSPKTSTEGDIVYGMHVGGPDLDAVEGRGGDLIVCRIFDRSFRDEDNQMILRMAESRTQIPNPNPVDPNPVGPNPIDPNHV